MKHSQVLVLQESLRKASGLIGFEINFCIKKNLQRIKTAIEPLAEMETEMLNIIKPFNDAKTELKKQYATVSGIVKYKQKEGKTVFDIPEEKFAEFEKAVFDLSVEHKNIIDSYETKMNEYVNFLQKTESDFKITTVSAKYVPKDISTENMNCIFDLIECEEK